MQAHDSTDIARIVDDAASREASASRELEVQFDLGLDLDSSRIKFQLNCLQAELTYLNDNHDLRLAYTVLVAIITSTTVNVVGLFVLVAKWMYPANSSWQVCE